MVGEEALDGLDDRLVDGMRTLAVRLLLDLLEQAGVVQDGFVGEFHQILRSSEIRGATIRR
jgi:hypothetical protein